MGLNSALLAQLTIANLYSLDVQDFCCLNELLVP